MEAHEKTNWNRSKWLQLAVSQQNVAPLSLWHVSTEAGHGFDSFRGEAFNSMRRSPLAPFRKGKGV